MATLEERVRSLMQELARDLDDNITVTVRTNSWVFEQRDPDGEVVATVRLQLVLG